VPFVRINHIPLKPGGADSLRATQAAFLEENDPVSSGLLYAFFGFSADDRVCTGVTIWSDKEKFDASGERWPQVVDGIRDILDGEARRDEFEIDSHNLPMSDS
jgi:hypothetical protein